jgi:DNA-binding transcriptional ArsR family regulator
VPRGRRFRRRGLTELLCRWLGFVPPNLTLRIARIYLQVMRSAAPALLPVFRSQLQADILAALLLNPEREYSLTDLAHRFDSPLSTVHGEVKRLTDAGLLHRRNVGRSTMVRANQNNRLVEPLAKLLFLSWGPLQVVADEFSELDGAERVLIFGSWAARYLQWPGPPPHDLDVLVVGHPTREAVYDAADRAQQRLAMPVNPVIRTGDAWREAADPLVQQIQSGPFVVVLMPDDANEPSAVEKGPGDA